MNINNLKPGMLVKLTNIRPSFWNSKGEMDRYLGKTVKIKTINKAKGWFRIIQDPEDSRKTWEFMEQDIVEILPPDVLIFN